MKRLGKMYDIISKMDFFNQRAARELWGQKPEKIQNQDIFNRHQDLCEIKEFVDDVAELMELEEQGLLLRKEDAVDEGHLQDWYIHSVCEDDEPIWTEAHIAELFNDFILIPKLEAEAKLKELENE